MKLSTTRAWMVALLAVCAGCSTPDSTNVADGTDPIVGDGEVAGAPAPKDGDEIFGSGGDVSYAEAPSSGPAAPGSAGTGGWTGTGNGTIQPGTLTAGVWDDNQNFGVFVAYRDKIKAQGTPGLLTFDNQEHDAARAAANVRPAKQELDISLVIDTTGSMGDEIAYLQTEFDALAATIQAKYPGAAQHWSLVLYKDTMDEYVTRWFDFRADTVEFRSKLAAQSAGGGADFPEAADQGLSIAHRLSWRTSPSTAKLMFWVADAPHHAEKAQKMTDAIRGARDKGIHIYPVASSGIDEMTELTMREAAQITGGRYLFLTDDSGVGNDHKEASVPCYFVTKLDNAILRMVDVELSGAYREPTAAELVRSGGNPQSGACKLASGQTVTIY
ncbi:MAG: hypothetical protein JWP87_4453 [Labilithrix sp.]|nr:hypothetical protein [Labilithrix sp.]